MDEVPGREEELLILLKTLADGSRLQILRLLNQREYPVGELAREMELSEPTVSHHLARMREAGLVTLRMDANQRFYRLNLSGLARFRALAGRMEEMPEAPPPAADDAWIAALDWPEDDKQVLRDHTSGPKLTRLPNKRKKTAIVLRWIGTLFEKGRQYSEAEVNEVLMGVYREDYVSLRRDLIDYRILRRKAGGSKYWLEDDQPR